MTSREFRTRLRRRAEKARLSLPASVIERSEVYFRLLEIWNRKINLTALDLAQAAPETLDRLLVEPMVAAQHTSNSGGVRMDIGSGGGSPAVPMALVKPPARLVMVESKIRKAVFLREVTRAVGIDAEVAAVRHEELLSRPDLHEACDLLTVRAVRTEVSMLSSLQAFMKPGGQLFLFRSATSAGPGGQIPPLLAWSATYPLVETLRSCLVVLEKRVIGR